MPNKEPPRFYNEAGPDPDEILGLGLAQELYQRGYNPWNMGQAARVYSEDVGIPRQARLRAFSQGPDDPSNQMGGFSSPSRVSYRSNPKQPVFKAPLDPEYSQIVTDRTLSPELQLLAIRHELEHAKEFYEDYYGGGPQAIEVPLGPHFRSGAQQDVEPGFILRPWMLR